jgi:predicted nuclease of predicted toxin-antitoxin system
MRIYLDEDISSTLLVTLLQKVGHQVIQCADAGMAGKSDPENLLYAIRLDRVTLTRNHGHFEHLHALVIGSRGSSWNSGSSLRQ